MSRLEEMYAFVRSHIEQTGTQQYDDDLAITETLMAGMTSKELAYFIAALGYHCLTLETTVIGEATGAARLREKLLEVRNITEYALTGPPERQEPYTY